MSQPDVHPDDSDSASEDFVPDPLFEMIENFVHNIVWSACSEKRSIDFNDMILKLKDELDAKEKRDFTNSPRHGWRSSARR